MTRSGFSLIEIMIAMAICMLGLTTVFQMAWTSQRYAEKSADLTDQQVLCQNRLNELVAGMREWEDVENRVCEEDDRFRYSIRTRLHPEMSMRIVEVTISRANANKTTQGNGWFDSGSQKNNAAGEFRLERFLPSPPVRSNDPDPAAGPSPRPMGEVFE